MSEELMTPEEKEMVLDEAITLIKEPASWTTGSWKCDLYETDKNGLCRLGTDGNPVRACDHYNRPLSQYCVEGAVNQAVHNKLGEERAVELGACKPGDDLRDNDKFSGDDESEIWPTDILGIDALARKRHAGILEDAGEEGSPHAAMIVNDYFEDRDNQAEGHTVILGLLETRRTQVKKQLGKKPV